MVSYLQSNIHGNIKKKKRPSSHSIQTNVNSMKNNYIHSNQENISIMNNIPFRSSMKIRSKEISGNA